MENHKKSSGLRLSAKVYQAPLNRPVNSSGLSACTKFLFRHSHMFINGMGAKAQLVRRLSKG